MASTSIDAAAATAAAAVAALTSIFVVVWLTFCVQEAADSVDFGSMAVSRPAPAAIFAVTVTGTDNGVS